MEKETPKKLKPLKDVDSVSVSLFVKGLVWPLVFLGLLGFVGGAAMGGVAGAFIGVVSAAVASVFVSLIAMAVSDKFGRFFAFIYKGPSANWSIEEQLAGDLDQVRYQKMNRRFDLALTKVDEVLARAPSFADALYLKAGILWEGFGEAAEAKRNLAAIMKTTSKTDSRYGWASDLYAVIVREEKRRLSNGGEEEA